MTAYRWTCHLCSAVNEPDSATCQKCGFPAEATSEEIELARAAGSSAAVHEARAKEARERAEWKAQPFWFKSVVVVLTAAFGVELFLLRFAGPIEYNLLGLGIFGILAGLFGNFWVAQKVRGKPK